MVYIILADGFEEIEAISPCDILRRGGVDVKYAGIGGKLIKGSHGIAVEADCILEEVNLSDAELVIVPGGLRGVNNIKASELAMKTVKSAYDDGKKVAAICAGPTVLAQLGITDGRIATCYPGMENRMGSAKMMKGASSVTDGQVITGKSAGTALDFSLRILEELRGSAAADKVAGDIFYDGR